MPEEIINKSKKLRELILIIVAVIVLIGMLVFIMYTQVNSWKTNFKNEVYTQGANDGARYIYNVILNDLAQYGYTQIVYDNQTIKLVPQVEQT